jgi:hypothetical protein
MSRGNNSYHFQPYNSFESSGRPSSSNQHNHSPRKLSNHNPHEVILISRSENLAFSLSRIMHCVVHSVDDLPLHSDIRAAVLDAEYARIGSPFYLLSVLCVKLCNNLFTDDFSRL